MAFHWRQSGSSFALRCTFRLVPVVFFPSAQLATVYSLGKGWGDHKGWSSGWDILFLGVAVPDASGRNAEAVWVGDQSINCSLVEEQQMWESSFYIKKLSRNLKHSYPSPETALILIFANITVGSLISCGVDDFFLILQGCQGNDASSPHWVEQPSSLILCLSMSLMGFAVILWKSREKCQVHLLLTSLACILFIYMKIYLYLLVYLLPM